MKQTEVPCIICKETGKRLRAFTEVAGERKGDTFFICLSCWAKHGIDRHIKKEKE